MASAVAVAAAHNARETAAFTVERRILTSGLSRPAGCSSQSKRVSVPGQGRARLVLRDPGFEEVLLLREVGRLRHPRERVVTQVALGQAEPFEPAIRDVLDVGGKLRRVEAEDAVGAGLVSIGLFEADRALDQRLDFGLELRRPDAGILLP